ncbi:MAG: PAS domain S-box protein [Ignavibacteriales bacterium]|nr:MAG: PAS domain S-box protein [Ignavibacteriales bacterium]
MAEINKPFDNFVRTLSSVLFKRGMIVAWFTLIITLSITVYAWISTEKNIDAGMQETFNYLTNDISNAINDRMRSYQQILRGGQSLFYASEKVNREEWKNYVDNLKLEENYSGILGVGYAKIIYKEDLKKHIDDIRKEDFPSYRVWPEGERDLYTSIIFLEPFNNLNQRAFGFDMLTEPVRRKAMETARDNGRAAVSGKVTLIQEIGENIQPGFLMYLPLYKQPDGTSAEERKENLIGYVFSPFRTYDLMSGLFGDQLQNVKLEIYDDYISGENLLFSSVNMDSVRKFNERSNIERFKSININGRDWILRFSSLPGYTAAVDKQKPLIVLILGIVVSSLLFIIARNLSSIFIINKKLEQLLESTIEGIYGLDRKGRCTFINNSAAEMLGYDPEECFKKDMHTLVHHHKANGEIYPSNECPILRSMEKKKGCMIDSDVYWKKDGTSFPIEYSSYPITDNGITTGAVVAFTDITERKKSVDQIEASLKEKEVLLREIHHRVKNNLQIISSMLNLQTNYITDQKSLSIFEESRNRVRSMALIHEKLYQNKSLSSLNIKEYIIELVNNLMNSYRTNTRVSTVINISDLFINTDTAIPLGLIINEIVSNSLKYAFPDGRTGKITLKLDLHRNDEYRMIVEDDGIGLPEKFDLKKTNTLGLQLVSSLVTQLEGEIFVRNQTGTSFLINFRGINLKNKKKLT